MKSAFLKAGHLPTLIACFLYFDLSFMVWVLLGPMAVLIAHDLNLNPGQKGLMVAVPVLAGALLRIVNGILVGQLHPRLTGLIMQVIVIAGLIGAWLIDIHSFQQMLMLGVVLGVAGASFAIALPPKGDLIFCVGKHRYNRECRKALHHRARGERDGIDYIQAIGDTPSHAEKKRIAVGVPVG